MRILQVSPTDVRGGAEAVALSLHRGLRARGHDAWLAVGRTRAETDGVLRMRNGTGAWSSAWWRLHDGAEDGGRWRAARLARVPAEPGTALDWVRGHEDFRFPGTRRLLELPPQRPELLHVHNLHGGYFDLTALPGLAAAVPTVATLHDAWLFTGHCAQPRDCDGWLRGCGGCPYLDVYPAIRRDGTAFNFARKRALWERTRLHVVAPSRWLADLVPRSSLAPAAIDVAVIPNGVDLARFAPGDRDAARRTLGLATDAQVLVHLGAGLRRSPWKDWPTLRSALGRLASEDGPPLVLFALGDDAPEERFGRARVVTRTVAPDVVPAYLAAADAYVHPARADTYPGGVVEALAVGVPVVATRTGGIPEQVAALGEDSEPTGILVPERDPAALAEALSTLLGDRGLRGRLAAAARAKRGELDLDRQLDAYEALYERVSAAAR